MLVIDSGAVTWFAQRSGTRNTVLRGLIAAYGPPTVPVAVLVECTTGTPKRDTLTNRFLQGCEVIETLPTELARVAAVRRHSAGRGSAVDAIVAVFADGGAVVTGDVKDLQALVHERTTVIPI